MRKVYIFAVLLTCTKLALFSLTATASYLDTPNLASIAFPHNGHTQVNRSISLYRKGAVRSVNKQRKPKIDADTLALAKEGLTREPLAVSGYFLIAASTDIEGEPNNALKTMQLASKLTTRNLFINSWLVEYSSKTNDITTALEFTDRLIRVDRDLEDVLITIMAQALEEKETIALVLEKLERSPPWGGKFWWATAKSSDEAIKNATRLRMLAYGKKLSVPKEYDQSIVSELVRRGHFNEAYKMVATISPDSMEKNTNLVRNGTFDGPKGLPPLDWSVSTELAVSGFIDRTAGQLHLSAAANSEGLLAEQVLRLPAGDYRVSVEFAPGSAPQKGQIAISLSCVSGYGSAPEWRSEPHGQKFGARFMSDGNCSVYRLSIEASEKDGEGFDLTLSRITILRSAIASRT